MMKRERIKESREQLHRDPLRKGKGSFKERAVFKKWLLRILNPSTRVLPYIWINACSMSIYGL